MRRGVVEGGGGQALHAIPAHGGVRLVEAGDGREDASRWFRVGFEVVSLHAGGTLPALMLHAAKHTPGRYGCMRDCMRGVLRRRSHESLSRGASLYSSAVFAVLRCSRLSTADCTPPPAALIVRGARASSVVSDAAVGSDF